MDRASVYILRCSDGSLYVGLTRRPVEARVSEHNVGTIPGYTAHRRPVELLYSEAHARLDEAIAAERRIKGWSRAKKLAYVRGDFPTLRVFAKRGGSLSETERRVSGSACFETPPLAAPQHEGG